jgi:hypothetical protein
MNDSASEVKNTKTTVEFSSINNYLEGLLSSTLLFLGFTTTNTILGFELLKKQVSHTVSLQWEYIPPMSLFMDFSYHELEVKDYGSVELECLNFKLPKPKVVRGGRKWTAY